MNTKRKLIALLAIATLVSIVNASVFVYYPINMTINPQQPPVVFVEGDNANQPDLWGNTNTIGVIIGNTGTSLSITVHPTLQRNYYYNISLIKNNDSNNAYYVKFRVNQAITDSRVTKAYLIINSSSAQYLIDLADKEIQPSSWIELSASDELRVDLYIVLNDYSGSSISVEVDLIYSMTNSETPPTPPA